MCINGNKVGDAITNAYAETVKADPNMKVTEAQIEAYKKQSKKNIGSRENAIAQILIKGDELKSTLSNNIDEAKGRVKAAGITVDETTGNRMLQGDGDGGRIKGNITDETQNVIDEGGYDPKLLDELANSGVKYSAMDVISIIKTPEGKIVWIENGNSNAGLEHIMNHADEFFSQGISKENIPNFLMQSIKKGKIIGYQGRGTGRPIYEIVYEGVVKQVAITTGSNGFVVGANPISVPKKEVK